MKLILPGRGDNTMNGYRSKALRIRNRSVFPLLWLLVVSAKSVYAQEAPMFDCLIEPWETVEVSFADHGILQSINVEVGDTIKKGDVLASLESGVEAASVELRTFKSKLQEGIRSAKATKEFSERNLKRIRDLYEKKAVPYHKLDEAETDAKVAENQLKKTEDDRTLSQLELKMAQQVLWRRTIYSPINGIVIKRHKSVGEYLEEEPVLTLAQVNPLRVHVLMPVVLYGQVEKEMRAMVVPEEPLSMHRKEAEVVIVDKNVDVASGTFGVQLELDNRSGEIPGGLKCMVKFDDLNAPL